MDFFDPTHIKLAMGLAVFSIVMDIIWLFKYKVVTILYKLGLVDWHRS
jgi:hypothetical protein